MTPKPFGLTGAEAAETQIRPYSGFEVLKYTGRSESFGENSRNFVELSHKR